MKARPAQVLRRSQAFGASTEGSTAIEYALIASLVGLAIVAGLSGTGNSVAGSFNYVLTLVAEVLGGR